MKIYVENKFHLKSFIRHLMGIVRVFSVFNDVLFIHAAGLKIQDKGMLFPAWQTTGKTSLVLECLNCGAKLIGEDWVVAGPDNKLYLYDHFYPVEKDFKEMKHIFKKQRNYNTFKCLVSHKLNKIKPYLSWMKFLQKTYRYIDTHVLTQCLDTNQLNKVGVDEAVDINYISILSRYSGNEIITKKMSSAAAAQKIFSILMFENRAMHIWLNMYSFAFPDSENLWLRFQENTMRKITDIISNSCVEYICIPENMSISALKEYILSR